MRQTTSKELGSSPKQWAPKKKNTFTVSEMPKHKKKKMEKHGSICMEEEEHEDDENKNLEDDPDNYKLASIANNLPDDCELDALDKAEFDVNRNEMNREW